jgi:hypothetical protein
MEKNIVLALLMVEADAPFVIFSRILNADHQADWGEFYTTLTSMTVEGLVKQNGAWYSLNMERRNDLRAIVGL